MMILIYGGKLAHPLCAMWLDLECVDASIHADPAIW